MEYLYKSKQTETFAVIFACVRIILFTQKYKNIYGWYFLKIKNKLIDEHEILKWQFSIFGHLIFFPLLHNSTYLLCKQNAQKYIPLQSYCRKSLRIPL